MTVDDFRHFYPAFDKISDEVIEYYLLEFLKVENENWGRLLNSAQGLWTAHMIITNPNYINDFDPDFAGNVLSQEYETARIGDVSVSGGSKKAADTLDDVYLIDYQTSVYGRRFLLYKGKVRSIGRLVKRCI